MSLSARPRVRERRRASARLPEGGRFLNRNAPLNFSFDGVRMRGLEGDTLASALLANGRTLVGRSFKYHRPRGIVASGAEEPNALVGLGSGARLEPNQRATTTELFEGLEAASQNRWPSLGFDLGAIAGLASRALPAGFYYKTFIHPRVAWKRLFEPLIRRAAGLGRAPREPDPDRYEHFHVHADVLVIGGGVAGLAAARTAAGAGCRVLLLEQRAHWGGRAPVDGVRIDGKAADEWVAETVDGLEAMPNARLRLRCMGAGVYDHGYALACERLGESGSGEGAPRLRLWKIRARQVVTATGAIERPLAFAGNDLPGAMLASAARDYLANWAVSPGGRTVVVTNNDDAYRTAIALKRAGLEVPAVLDARQSADGPLPSEARALGIDVRLGSGVARAKGRGRIECVAVAAQDGDGAELDEIRCDALAMSGGWSPAVHLWSHCGGGLFWDADGAMFRPDPAKSPSGRDGEAFVRAAGGANGELATDSALADAHAAGVAAAGTAGGGVVRGEAPRAEPEEAGPIMPVWMMPDGAGPALREKAWLDYQNDVKVSDVELAAREGYESVEHAKRYTTLGMATDQGKLGNVNGLAILSRALGESIPDVGTTTFRPPYAPVPIGAVVGEARGEAFQPVRRTPMHDWHESAGAHWEPVGLWRRPYCYLREGESAQDAVRREVRNARSRLGILDASTLGKLLVKGPDAGKFLDMLYTNMLSSLKVGRCRYGLMCDENGFLIDDGVVARLTEDAFLCHTTTGGAGRIHAHMEEWLQTEWWDWKVYVADLTEQYAQVAVAGPEARKALESLGGMDLSEEALPFMSWADGEIGGFACRTFRISFSGELGFEIAVKASEGVAFWSALAREGGKFGAMPYGTEALHVMRAEKGFIMIGDETDGTVIPQDLGLDWAISKKKDDYIGKRGQMRLCMTDPERWRLVGLETLDGSTLPDGAHALGEGENDYGRPVAIGRVTSTYFSPTLGRGIAMGLVRRGPERMGEVIQFATPDVPGKTTKARIVSPSFLDRDGEKGDA